MAILHDLDDLARRVIDGVFQSHWAVGRKWCRLVMNEEIGKILARLAPASCSVVEISGNLHADVTNTYPASGSMRWHPRVAVEEPSARVECVDIMLAGGVEVAPDVFG